MKERNSFQLYVNNLFTTRSSPYDICETIVNMGDSICPSFPEGQPCGCPLLAGDFDLKNVELAVPDFGPILGPLMAVSIVVYFFDQHIIKYKHKRPFSFRWPANIICKSPN